MRGPQLMLAISLLPSGTQSLHKETHYVSNNYDPWYCTVILCTAHSLYTSSRRSFVVQGDPDRPGENTNECSELMSAQTHRVRRGGLCCLLWFRSTFTTRPSKHSQSFYSLTVLPPASTPPQRLLFSVLAPGVGVRVNEEAWLRLSNTEEGSLLHGSLTLFSLANFSFRLTSPPQNHTAHTRRHTFSSPAHSPSSAPCRFWWWLWHACCHASVLQEAEINRATAIWGETSHQNCT